CDAWAASITADLSAANIITTGDLVDTMKPYIDNHPDYSRKISIRVGEAAYNFRAALDYLVGQLSLGHTPTFTLPGRRKNQFPIEHRPHVFDSRRNTWLAGVSDEHVAR